MKKQESIITMTDNTLNIILDNSRINQSVQDSMKELKQFLVDDIV